MQKLSRVKVGCTATLEYPFANAPTGGQLREVAPGIFWLRMPLPFALEHINLWLLADGDGWAIVDCGFGTDETRELWRQIFATRLCRQTVNLPLFTHFSP